MKYPKSLKSSKFHLPFFIAVRYLIARKTHNIINVISLISVAGVAVGTMALIIVLSVFNGFESLVISLFNTFNPDIVVTPVRGKTFSMSEISEDSLLKIPGILAVTQVVEETALLKYRDNQFLATIKGVSKEIHLTSGLDTMIVDGRFELSENGYPRMVLGAGVAYYLNASINDLLNPVVVYLPRREARFGTTLEGAFESMSIFPSGIFSIQQDFDVKYVFVPLEFARELCGYSDEVTSLEIAVTDKTKIEQIKQQIIRLLGNDFEVKNRFEQQELLYKIMKTEKWAIFFILTFIIIIAAFNVISSLSMLILDKQDNIHTLYCLGADNQLIRRIFLLEGVMISIGGAVAGLVLGGILSWMQQHFGFITLGSGEGNFVVDTYPVEIQWLDFVYVLVTVLIIGYLIAWFPVQRISIRNLGFLNRKI